MELSIDRGDDTTRRMIIDEMLSNKDFDRICQDRYGKYVVQKALFKTTGELNERLAQAAKMSSRNSMSDTYDPQ